MKKSKLTFTTVTIPSASLGEPSPLADVGSDTYIRAPIEIDETIPPEEAKYIGKGMIETLLPYKIQNNYTRERVPTPHPCAVLENDCLRATFLTGLGGRLYSLFDKKQGRELLYCNPVFQPGNLALRGAWFSGGIEWNVGIKGHNPLTCSPLYARRAVGEDGEDMLEMFEYERKRGVTYTLRFKLADDVLFLKVIIENRNAHPVNMYWWSNIAVCENKDTRVIAPTKTAIRTTYRDGNYALGITEYPMIGGVDCSYPAHISTAVDYFYRVSDEPRDKWVAAVEPDGSGFAEFSDKTLRGKKLFLWGKEKGGPHWNEWLSDGSANYIEIQAGIMRTQMEHFPMAAESVIEFREAFSSLNISKDDAVSESYSRAAEAVAKALDSRFDVLEKVDFTVSEYGELESYGSGWGALESLLQKRPVSLIQDFPMPKADGECRDALMLLKTGELPVHPVTEPISAFMTGEHWRKLVLAASESWYRSYLLGVISYELVKVDEALEYYEESVSLEPNPWAYHDIASILKNYKHDISASLEYMRSAFELLPSDFNLAVMYAGALIAAGKHEEWLDVYENILNKDLKRGRLKMLAAHSAAESAKPERAIAYLTQDFLMPDLKEGEFSVFAIWLKAHGEIMKKAGKSDLSEEAILREYPLPYELDFRMH